MMDKINLNALSPAGGISPQLKQLQSRRPQNGEANPAGFDSRLTGLLAEENPATAPIIPMELPKPQSEAKGVDLLMKTQEKPVQQDEKRVTIQENPQTLMVIEPQLAVQTNWTPMVMPQSVALQDLLSGQGPIDSVAQESQAPVTSRFQSVNPQLNPQLNQQLNVQSSLQLLAAEVLKPDFQSPEVNQIVNQAAELKKTAANLARDSQASQAKLEGQVAGMNAVPLIAGLQGMKPEHPELQLEKQVKGSAPGAKKQVLDHSLMRGDDGLLESFTPNTEMKLSDVTSPKFSMDASVATQNPDLARDPASVTLEHASNPLPAKPAFGVGLGALSGEQFLSTMEKTPEPQLKLMEGGKKRSGSIEGQTGPLSFESQMLKSESNPMAAMLAPVVVTGRVVQGPATRERLDTVSVRDMGDGIQKLAAQAQSANFAPQSGEMRIRLKPENLGELVVRISTEGSRVGLKIQASSENAKRVLEESMSSLKDNLALNKLRLETVDLSVVANRLQPQSSPDSQSGSQSDQRHLAQQWLGQGGLGQESSRQEGAYQGSAHERESAVIRDYQKEMPAAMPLRRSERTAAGRLDVMA